MTSARDKSAEEIYLRSRRKEEKDLRKVARLRAVYILERARPFVHPCSRACTAVLKTRSVKQGRKVTRADNDRKTINQRNATRSKFQAANGTPFENRQRSLLPSEYSASGISVRLGRSTAVT